MIYELIQKYKREFVYSSYLFLIFELLVTKEFVYSPLAYIIVAITGLLIILIWIFVLHVKHGGKTVSKWSSVLLGINFKDRLFSNIIVPISLYLTISSFLFFDVSRIINQLIIVCSVGVFFALFIHVKASYEKIYSISHITRNIYDFVNLFIFILVALLVYRLPIHPFVEYMLLCFFAFYAVLFAMYSRKYYGYISLVFAVGIGVLIGIVDVLVKQYYILNGGLILGVILYMILSVMHVRFDGNYKVSAYIPTLMYTVMSLILILSV